MTAAQLQNSIDSSSDLGTSDLVNPKNDSRLKKRLCILFMTLALVGFFISVLVYFIAIKPYLATSKGKKVIASESIQPISTAVSTNKTSNFTFTNIHYTKGSTPPIIPDDGILRFYSMRFCPYSHRVHLVLNAKNIPYHVIYINLSEKPEWYAHVNPNGKVPALQLVNEPYSPILTESMIICEYLDEKYPDNHLYPKDPLERAQTKMWFKRFIQIDDLFHLLAFDKKSENVSGELLNRLCAGLKEIEEELSKRGTKYFGGENVNILDYAFWPWFERFGVLKSFFGEQFPFNYHHYPLLIKWILNMKDDEAVAKHYLAIYTHTKFVLGVREETPNFNILVDDEKNQNH